jgi:hypothetical protein
MFDVSICFLGCNPSPNILNIPEEPWLSRGLYYICVCETI